MTALETEGQSRHSFSVAPTDLFRTAPARHRLEYDRSSGNRHEMRGCPNSGDNCVVDRVLRAPSSAHIVACREEGMTRNMWIRLVLFAAGAVALATPAIADATSFTLRYGVLAGLTGDPAPSGQGWNEAARLGIETIAQTLKSMGLNSIQVLLADSQDSQGNPQAGVEAAQKLASLRRCLHRKAASRPND
jgi:hypothetical protein